MAEKTKTFNNIFTNLEADNVIAASDEAKLSGLGSIVSPEMFALSHHPYLVAVRWSEENDHRVPYSKT